MNWIAWLSMMRRPPCAPLVDIGRPHPRTRRARCPSACAATLGPRLVERGKEDAQAVARRAEKIGARHAATVERERRGRRRAMAHLVLERARLRRPAAPFSTISAEIAVPRLVDPRPFAEQQNQIGHVAVGDEGLAPLTMTASPSGREARGHGGGVGAGLGLGDRQGSQRTLGQARQKTLLLLVIAEVDEGLHRVKIGGVDDARRGAGGGDDLHHFEIGAIAHRRAAIGLRNEDRVQCEFVDRLDVRPGERALFIDFGRVRRDDFVGKTMDLVEEQPLVLGPLSTTFQALKQLRGQWFIPCPPSI